MSINVIEITIIKDTEKSKSGKVYVKTNLPDSIPTNNTNLIMTFYAVDAEKYCSVNFPNVKVNVVSSSGQ